MGSEPTPDLLAALQEEHDRLLGLLGDVRLQEIARLRIEGFAVQEIAERLDIGKRSVERKLDLIRKSWSQELGDDYSLANA